MCVCVCHMIIDYKKDKAIEALGWQEKHRVKMDSGKTEMNR